MIVNAEDSGHLLNICEVPRITQAVVGVCVTQSILDEPKAVESNPLYCKVRRAS